MTKPTGATGMAIVRAIVDGERDPMKLAALRDRRCRKTAAEIAEHLSGNWRDEFRVSPAPARLRRADHSMMETPGRSGRRPAERSLK
jgi:hypothetical protein